MTEPNLTVIITSSTGLSEALACLAAILLQSCGRHVELILAYRSEDQTLPAVGAAYPQVTFLPMAPSTTLPRLLGAAMARATGTVVAVTDAACSLHEAWIPAILSAHDSPHPIIGGAVEPSPFDRLVDWAAYFSEYGQFMLPLAGGVANELPGNNFSVKRRALAEDGSCSEEFWKTHWCRRMQAAGVALYSSPAMIVFYRKSFRLWPFLGRRFHHGRCFAGLRVAQITGMKRVIYLLGSPVLPILFLARTLQAVLPKRRYRRPFLLSLPIIGVAFVSWALGEFCGYLLGPGASCRHVR